MPVGFGESSFSCVMFGYCSGYWLPFYYISLFATNSAAL